MSRRERREAEKSGRIAPPIQPTPEPKRVALVETDSSQPLVKAQLETNQVSQPPALPSRRQLREGGRTESLSPANAALTATDSVLLPREVDEVAKGESPAPQQQNPAIADPQAVLPAVSLSSQVSVVEQPAFADPIFSAEPSTNSIVLDRIPDAVGVPIEVTGEIITTGSIAILTEPVNTVLTGPLDDRALDSISANDAVTGAITVVEPVSALQVIKNRPIQSVLPVRGLRSGWWKPVLLAAATIAMVAAAVAAALVIINTLGL